MANLTPAERPSGSDRRSGGISPPLGVLMTLGGLLLFLAARIAAWWNHG
jgi:hypothetical protein